MKNFNQFIKELKGIRLSYREKRASWAYLSQELNLKPASMWRWQVYIYTVASLVIALALGTGISQAAEGAVPGDILYLVKTKVKEPVERALVAKTPEKLATFETNLVERRLDEAEQVLSKKSVTEQVVKDNLKQKIAEQTARAIDEQNKVKEVQNKVDNKTEKEDKKEERKEKNEDDLKNIFREHEQVIRDLEKKDRKDVRKGEDKRQNKGKKRD